MDATRFDERNYPIRSVRDGYGEWAASYEASVQDVMDLRLLAKIQSVPWDHIQTGADLACGTGRIGVWLKEHDFARDALVAVAMRTIPPFHALDGVPDTTSTKTIHP